MRVFHGAPGGPADVETTRIVPEGSGACFGCSLAGVGDIDGDGFDDVVAGAYLAGPARGRIDLFLGGPDGLPTTPDQAVWGFQRASWFGYSVSPAGDVDGDGYGDVLVGAPSYDDSSGAALVLHGTVAGLETPARRAILGSDEDDSLGYAAVGVGDVDRDGFDDILVSAPRYRGSLGRLELYPGSADGILDTPTHSLVGDRDYAYLGKDLVAVGDTDADGYPEFAARIDNDGGRFLVHHFGPDGLEAAPRATISAEDPDSVRSLAAAAAGDPDGDGHADFLLGDEWDGSWHGRVTAYTGGPDGLAAVPDTIATGDERGDDLGSAVAGVGDVDGDGLDDVLIGADGAEDDIGRVTLHYGWKDLDGDGAHVGGGWDHVDDCDDSDPDLGAPAPWYVDEDGDGYGAIGSEVVTCETPADRIPVGGDCDDDDPERSPAAEEVWYDGIDQDCDGNDQDQDRDGRERDIDCDDTDPRYWGPEWWYLDADGDGHGDPEISLEACTAPEGYVEDGDDCDDSDPTRWLDCTEPDEDEDEDDSGGPAGDTGGQGSDTGEGGSAEDRDPPPPEADGCGTCSGGSAALLLVLMPAWRRRDP